jgi:CelD/BcsL family acetyltransferase involved in cellulose biosynthesis
MEPAQPRQEGLVMHIRVYEDNSAFEALRDEWNALLHRSITDEVFLTWEWQSTWWDVYQAGDLMVVAVRHDDGRLIGIAPWFVHTIGGERVLRTIGCVDVTDYVDVIADQYAVTSVQIALADFLAASRNRFDRVNLCNIPESSPTTQFMPDLLRQRGFDSDLVFQEVCPVIHLPSDWEEYLSMLDKKQRHEVRRKVRKAEAEANLEYSVLDSSSLPIELDDALVAEFLELMRASQPAKADFLATAANRTFLARILQTTARAGWLRLSFLRCDGQLAAAYADFIYNAHVQVYNSGLNPSVAPHLSLGNVLLAYNIQSAIERGIQVFNFLRGNETYKYRLGATDTRIYKLVARSLPPE